MKKIFFVAIVAAVAALSTGCFATTGRTSAVKGETKVNIPLSGAEYMSNDEYFRVTEIGESPNMSSAMKVARQNARQELAATVESAIKAVISNYTQTTATTDESIYEALATNVVKQKLSGAIEIGNEMYQTEDGRYKCYVCFQLSKKEMQDALANQLANEAVLKAQFDRERFMEIYDKELANY